MDVYLGLRAVLAAAAVVFFVVLHEWTGARDTGLAQGDPKESGPFIVRTYRGREQRDVVARYATDAEALAARGYEPVGQSWGDGQWDLVLFLLALILCLFGIGLILLAYMAIIRPAGTLLVTYRLASA